MTNQKGEFLLAATGYVQIRAYTSDARIPLANTAIAILNAGGGLVAARITDRSGQIDPVPVDTPELGDSLTPDFIGKPFTTVTIQAQHPDYEQIEVTGVQVFAGVVTVMPLEMVPIPSYPDQFDQVERFDIPAQNL